MLAERCLDGSLKVRPHIADILSLFEGASHYWVSSTSEAIANLGLDRPATQRPPTKEETLTTRMSEDASGDGRDVAAAPIRVPFRWTVQNTVLALDTAPIRCLCLMALGLGTPAQHITCGTDFM